MLKATTEFLNAWRTAGYEDPYFVDVSVEGKNTLIWRKADTDKMATVVIEEGKRPIISATDHKGNDYEIQLVSNAQLVECFSKVKLILW